MDMDKKCKINPVTYSVDADKSQGFMPYGEMDYAEEKNKKNSMRDKQEMMKDKEGGDY